MNIETDRCAMVRLHVRLISAVATALCLAFLPVILQRAAAQPTARSDQERLLQLETEQQYIKQAIKDTQDTTKYLLSTFAALMVVIQVAASLVQARREERAFKQQSIREDELEVKRIQRENTIAEQRQRREDDLEARRSQREQQLYTFWTQREDQIEKRRTEREDRLDQVTASSVQSVKNVLDVVSSTFEERRTAEKEGREATQKFNEKLDTLTKTISTLNAKIGDLEGFAADVRRTIENERQALENTAKIVPRDTPRHAFRPKDGAVGRVCS